MAHRNIPLPFQTGGRRVKISIFHEFPFCFGKQICRPAADSISMPKAMTVSFNLAYQEIILVHPTRRQIFAGKP